jgi:hypothetical protein
LKGEIFPLKYFIIICHREKDEKQKMITLATSVNVLESMKERKKCFLSAFVTPTLDQLNILIIPNISLKLFLPERNLQNEKRRKFFFDKKSKKEFCPIFQLFSFSLLFEKL